MSKEGARTPPAPVRNGTSATGRWGWLEDLDTSAEEILPLGLPTPPCNHIMGPHFRDFGTPQAGSGSFFRREDDGGGVNDRLKKFSLSAAFPILGGISLGAPQDFASNAVSFSALAPICSKTRNRSWRSSYIGERILTLHAMSLNWWIGRPDETVSPAAMIDWVSMP